MTNIDKWALHQTAVMVGAVEDAFDAYEFHRVYQLINAFCNETLSYYHDILKDRLYTYTDSAGTSIFTDSYLSHLRDIDSRGAQF